MFSGFWPSLLIHDFDVIGDLICPATIHDYFHVIGVLQTKYYPRIFDAIGVLPSDYPGRFDATGALTSDYPELFDTIAVFPRDFKRLSQLTSTHNPFT